MAYRRKQGLSRSSTFQEDVHDSPSSPIGPEQNNNNTLRTCYSFSPSSASSSSAAPSLAAQAIRATAARHGSVNPSLSFAHGDSALAASDHLALKGLEACGDEAGIGESKSGFWGVLAQKAKTILEEDMMSPRAYDMHEGIVISHPLNNTSINPAQQLKNHATLKGLGTITSPLNHEGRTMMMMENNNKSAGGDVRSQIKLKGSGDGSENSNVARPQLANTQTNHETQLKASRDVRWLATVRKHSIQHK